MGKYIIKESKPIEAFTFDEIIAYGKANPIANLIDGMPWCFNFKDRQIKYVNDKCYEIQIMKNSRRSIPFTPDDIIMVDEDKLYIYSAKSFNNVYEIVK